MKYWRKMKRRHRTCLGSLGRKCDMARQNDDFDRRRGTTEVGGEAPLGMGKGGNNASWVD
jgi:hypothetical protein